MFAELGHATEFASAAEEWEGTKTLVKIGRYYILMAHNKDVCMSLATTPLATASSKPSLSRQRVISCCNASSCSIEHHCKQPLLGRNIPIYFDNRGFTLGLSMTTSSGDESPAQPMPSSYCHYE